MVFICKYSTSAAESLKLQPLLVQLFLKCTSAASPFCKHGLRKGQGVPFMAHGNEAKLKDALPKCQTCQCSSRINLSCGRKASQKLQDHAGGHEQQGRFATVLDGFHMCHV